MDARIYGDKVIWTDDRYGNNDIFMKVLSTNVESRLTTNTASQGTGGIYADQLSGQTTGTVQLILRYSPWT
jgi:beta propeller repeat protein